MIWNHSTSEWSEKMQSAICTMMVATRRSRLAVGAECASACRPGSASRDKTAKGSASLCQFVVDFPCPCGESQMLDEPVKCRNVDEDEDVTSDPEGGWQSHVGGEQVDTRPDKLKAFFHKRSSLLQGISSSSYHSSTTTPALTASTPSL